MGNRAMQWCSIIDLYNRQQINTTSNDSTIDSSISLHHHHHLFILFSHFLHSYTTTISSSRPPFFFFFFLFQGSVCPLIAGLQAFRLVAPSTQSGFPRQICCAIFLKFSYARYFRISPRCHGGYCDVISNCARTVERGIRQSKKISGRYNFKV